MFDGTFWTLQKLDLDDDVFVFIAANKKGSNLVLRI